MPNGFYRNVFSILYIFKQKLIRKLNFIHTDGKTPSSKHFLNKRYRGKNKERRYWKSKEAEIPSGPFDETLFNLSRAERTSSGEKQQLEGTKQGCSNGKEGEQEEVTGLKTDAKYLEKKEADLKSEEAVSKPYSTLEEIYVWLFRLRKSFQKLRSD